MGGKLKQKSMVCRGLKTCWLEGGNANGPIMLFLHGYPDSPETFEHQYSAFSDRFHIIAPYSRGCLPSETDNDIRRYGHASQALDVLAILSKVDSSEQKKIIIVGHDLGVAHAWFLSGMIKERLLSVIILNGLSVQQMGRRLGNIRQQMKSWYIYAMLMPRAPKVILRRFSGQLLNFAYKRGNLSDEQRPGLKNALAGVVNPSLQYKAFVEDFYRGVVKSRTKIEAPVMVVWGRDDSFLEVPRRDEIEKDAIRAEIRILKANHWVHRERPSEVNALIDDFLLRLGEERV